MMAVNLLELIRLAKTRKSAQITVMHHFIKEGLSGSEALRRMQALQPKEYKTGLGMRRTDFFRFWTPMREMAGKVDKGDLLRTEQYPGSVSMTPTPFEQVRKFNYYVRVDVLDAKGDKVGEHYVTIADDWRMTKGEIEDVAIGVAEAYPDKLEEGGSFETHFSHGAVRPGRV